MLRLFSQEPSANGIRKAVAYYRHSAEDKQENSIPIQREQVRVFAVREGITILHEETDEGKSGLSADRPGFQALFREWIENIDAPPFAYVLVLDVSRWGRFQDPDEAGEWERRCTRHGKQVIYVTQGFPRAEWRHMQHLMKTVERHMAGEYSRQLSEKVFRGCIMVSKQGFWTGGPPPYGMRRLLLSETHKPLHTLEKGQQKEIANQRVTLVPEKRGHGTVVRRLFHMLVEERKMPTGIAVVLNAEHIPSPGGKKWNTRKVMHILQNETYIGTLRYNKTRNKLKEGRRKNRREDWILTPGAFPPLVHPLLFSRAQERLRELQKQHAHREHSKDVMRHSLRTQIRQVLGHRYDGDDVAMLFPLFPLLSSRRCLIEGAERTWVFLMLQHLRHAEQLLCVGVDEQTNTHVCFCVPAYDYCIGNCLLLREQEHRDMIVPESKLPQIVCSLFENLCRQHFHRSPRGNTSATMPVLSHDNEYSSHSRLSPL